MPAEGMQLVTVGRGDERFRELRRHFYGPAIQIEKPFVKMTKLDRVETIDLLEQPFTDRSAQHKKGMRRKGKDRSATGRIRRGGQPPTGAQFSNVIEIFKSSDF